MIDEIEKNGAVITIDVGRNIKFPDNSGGVVIGNYQLQCIDVSDVEKYPEDGGGSTQFGLTVHEIVEQYYKQINGLDYRRAHERGLFAEQCATGNAMQSSEGKKDANGNTTRIEVFMSKGGKTVTETVIFGKNGNIISVSQETED